MTFKNSLFFLLFGLLTINSVEAVGQTTVPHQQHIDITLFQKNLNQVNIILEKVIGKNLLRNLNLPVLKELAGSQHNLRESIRQTLRKKDVYSFNATDFHNLELLSHAINVKGAIVSKILLRTNVKEFPEDAKKSINVALNNILRMRAAIMANAPTSAHTNPVPQEILLQPIISEEEEFSYGSSLSNQLTPVAMCFVDLDFLNQTGGGNVAVARNIGTLKLLLLAKAQVVDKMKIYRMSDADKEKLVEKILSKESPKSYRSGQQLTNGEIYQIYDKARGELLKKVNPRFNCSMIRQQFGQ